MVMGLSVVAYLARKSMAKALMMAVVGIVLGCIGRIRSRQRLGLLLAYWISRTESASRRWSWGCSDR